MKQYLSFVLAFTAWAQPSPTLMNTSHFTFSPTVQNGDTDHCTGWTPSSSGGAWNGGHLLCIFNDGVMAGSGNRNMALWEITAYDPNNIANTAIALVNSMSGLGAAGTNGVCAGASSTYKSTGVWSDGGKLYWAMDCQTNGSPWATFQAWLAVSPDGGAHWCNLAQYTAGGNTCTSANWSATGAVPTGNTSSDMQWGGLGAFTGGYMDRLGIIQIAQDGATLPTLPGGLSNSYHYAYSIRYDGSNFTHLYLHRYTGDPMLKANWTHFNAGSWDADETHSTDILPINSAVTLSGIYSPDLYDGAGGFLLVGYTGAYTFWQTQDLVHLTALPPTQGYSVPLPYAGIVQWPAFMLPTYQTLVAGKKFTMSMSLNGQDISPATCSGTTWCYVPGFTQLAFRPPNVRSGAPVGQ